MNKKIFGIIFLAGILVLTGAGCGNGSVADNNITPSSQGEDKNSEDIYGSAKEISSSDAIAGELKSILSEACGAVKLTEEYPPSPVSGQMFVYVWRDKPTAEKLESAFIRNGYTIEIGGEALIVKKGNTVLGVSWVEEMESQEIGIGITKEE